MMKSPPKLKRQTDHLEKKPAKRKSKGFYGDSEESSEEDSRNNHLEESLNTQNQAVLSAQTSPLVKKCSVVIEKLSLEDAERISGIEPRRTNVKSVPQSARVQSFDTHSNEHLDLSDGSKPQVLGSNKDARTSSQELLSNATTSNSCIKIEIDLDAEEALLDYSFSSGSEYSDDECTDVNRESNSSLDYDLLVKNKNVLDTTTVEGTHGLKESFSRDKILNVNSSKHFNSSKDLSLEIKSPICNKVSSVLCSSRKDADESDEFPKSSYTPVENVIESAPKTTPKGPKPKLTKTSILKKPIVNRKPIKKIPKIKLNFEDRIVDLSSTASKGVTYFKITKIFSNAGINNGHGTKESCASKQNLNLISNSKLSGKSLKFRKDTDYQERNIKSDLTIKPVGLLKRKIEDAHQENSEDQNGWIKKLQNSQNNNKKDKPTVEQSSSRKISFRNSDELKQYTKHNAPSSSGNEEPNKDCVPVIDYSFAKPNECPKKTMVETPKSDDDDNESVISFFATDELISDVDNDGKVLKHKRTWNKFGREKLDEQENELTDDEDTLQISSKQFTQKESNLATVAYSNKNKNNEERRDSPNHSRMENFKSWNQRSENLTANDNCTSTYSFKENTNYSSRDLKTMSSPESIIQDYCLRYLRMSVESHHGCNLIHQVPCRLFSEDILNEGQIQSVIKYIIKMNFKNPPKDLVSAIVLYCVRCNQSDLQRRTSTLISFGSSLKGVKIDNAEQLWCTYFKTICQYVDLPSRKKSLYISRVLEGIFGKQLDFRSEECEVFKLIQRALIEVHGMLKSNIQLLTCVEFMCEKISNSRLDLRLICPEFAISIVKQCLEKMNTLPVSTWISFAYKVVFNLISDYHFHYVIDLYNRDKRSICQFIEILVSRKVFNSVRLCRIQQFISTHEFEKSSLGERGRSESQLPLNNHVTSKSTVQADSDQALNFQTISKSLENSYDKGELDVEEVYSDFKHPDKRKIFFSCLTELKVDVKKHLSDVIMSFISDEANNENWYVCYELFKCLPDWDFKKIKNLKGNRTPISNLLTVILVLLKKKKTTDALNLFLQYELFNHEADWILRYIPEDITKHLNICSIFEEQIKSLGENRFFTIMRLICKQDTLDAPINLVENVLTLLHDLIDKGHQKNIVLLLSRLLDENKDEPLFVHSEDTHMYRALIVILCKENKLDHGLLMLLKAINHVKLYPCIPRRRDSVSPDKEMCIELHSSLRSEEIKVIVYTILKGFGDITQKSGFLVKFKEHLDGPQGFNFENDIFKPYILVEDTSVRNSIERFTRAVMELIPNARFKIRGHDGIEIEKISLKEFGDQLSET